MTRKYLRSSGVAAFLLSVSLSFTTQAGAATLVGAADFLEADDLTVILTDSNQTLEFLDLTTTAGMSVFGALSIYSSFGFELATDYEVGQLFSAFGFDYQFAPGTFIPLAGVSVAEASNFNGFLGVTATGSSSLGIFTDSSSITPYPWFCISVDECTPTNFTGDILDLTDGSPLLGVTLYRVSEVPVPAAIWLFGSALGLLFGRTRSRAN